MWPEAILGQSDKVSTSRARPDFERFSHMFENRGLDGGGVGSETTRVEGLADFGDTANSAIMDF